MRHGENDAQEYDEQQGGEQELVSYQEVTSAPKTKHLVVLNF